MGGLEQSAEKTRIVEGKSCTAFENHRKDSILVPSVKTLIPYGYPHELPRNSDRLVRFIPGLQHSIKVRYVLFCCLFGGFVFVSLFSCLFTYLHVTLTDSLLPTLGMLPEKPDLLLLFHPIN